MASCRGRMFLQLEAGKHSSQACIADRDVFWTTIDRLHQQNCNFTAGTSPTLKFLPVLLHWPKAPLFPTCWPNAASGIPLHKWGLGLWKANLKSNTDEAQVSWLSKEEMKSRPGYDGRTYPRLASPLTPRRCKLQFPSSARH